MGSKTFLHFSAHFISPPFSPAAKALFAACMNPSADGLKSCKASLGGLHF